MPSRLVVLLCRLVVLVVQQYYCQCSNRRHGPGDSRDSESGDHTNTVVRCSTTKYYLPLSLPVTVTVAVPVAMAVPVPLAVPSLHARLGVRVAGPGHPIRGRVLRPASHWHRHGGHPSRPSPTSSHASSRSHHDDDCSPGPATARGSASENNHWQAASDTFGATVPVTFTSRYCSRGGFDLKLTSLVAQRE